jgi:SAM-dependent methyltransferase
VFAAYLNPHWWWTWPTGCGRASDARRRAAIAASAWVQRWRRLIRPAARVLDVACGSGRHLRWLAAQGFASPASTATRRRGGAAAGPGRGCGRRHRERPLALPGRRFDAVVVTNYLWRPLLAGAGGSAGRRRRADLRDLCRRPETVGRPSRPDFLLQPGELLQACAGLRVVAYEDGFLPTPDASCSASWPSVAASRRPEPPYGLRPGPAAKIAASPFTACRNRDRMKPIVGSIVALVTPMHEDGSVDYAALRR